MIDIETNIAAINAQIQGLLAKKNCAQDHVTLVAVSKKQPVQAIRQATLAGQRDFGENYLQEALVKIAELQDLPLVWHFIGAIQSNKTRAIAEHFDWVHTVDRLKIAQRLSEQRPASSAPLNVCLQVNIDEDADKSGILAANCIELAQAVKGLPGLYLRGLMTITAARRNSEQSQASFARMRQLFETVKKTLGSEHFDSLSMGMSADWPQAIAQGANMIRVGSAIFGPRPG